MQGYQDNYKHLIGKRVLLRGTIQTVSRSNLLLVSVVRIGGKTPVYFDHLVLRRKDIPKKVFLLRNTMLEFQAKLILYKTKRYTDNALYIEEKVGVADLSAFRVIG